MLRLNTFQGFDRVIKKYIIYKGGEVQKEFKYNRYSSIWDKKLYILDKVCKFYKFIQDVSLKWNCLIKEEKWIIIIIAIIISNNFWY